MSYEVNSKLEVTSTSWRKIKINSLGFTAHGSLRYDVIDTRTEQKIIRVYIDPKNSVIKAYQGKHREITFKYSQGIDGSQPHFLLEKVVNFLMW